MKWMWSTALVVVAVSAAVTAQSGKGMKEPKMGDTMTTTYTGCVEDWNHGASYLLTHVAADHKTMAHHDGMMKSDSEMEKMEKKDASVVTLTGRPDLAKHVGEKVRVTGSLSHGMSEKMSSDRETLTIASLKVLAKSCS